MQIIGLLSIKSIRSHRKIQQLSNVTVDKHALTTATCGCVSLVRQRMSQKETTDASSWISIKLGHSDLSWVAVCSKRLQKDDLDIVRRRSSPSATPQDVCGGQCKLYLLRTIRLLTQPSRWAISQRSFWTLSKQSGHQERRPILLTSFANLY